MVGGTPGPDLISFQSILYTKNTKISAYIIYLDFAELGCWIGPVPLRVDSKSAQNSTRGNSLRVDSIFQIRAAEYVR